MICSFNVNLIRPTMELLKYLLLLSAVAAAAADFTAYCPDNCKCVWAAGNKQATCSHANLTELPNTFSSEIQILDLSNNPLNEITRRAFENVQLNNLKKLFLRECHLKTIHKQGLSGLAILIELDLSKNDLKELHADTFKEITKIRFILLNNNQLETLNDGLFSNLLFLHKVDLSFNRIKHIGVKTFMNVPKLHNLKLDNNQLELLDIDTLSALSSLSSLEVHDNPWKCNCYLQPLRNWIMSRNLYTTPIACAGPAKVQGKLWKELYTSEFACQPNILYPTANTTVQTHDSNITLPCQVNGNPLPEVNWVLNSQVIDGSYRYQGKVKYYLTESDDENSKWVNLTILAASTTDSAEYLCVAKNPAGVEERSVMLSIAQEKPGVTVANVSNELQ